MNKKMLVSARVSTERSNAEGISGGKGLVTPHKRLKIPVSTNKKQMQRFAKLFGHLPFPLFSALKPNQSNSERAGVEPQHWPWTGENGGNQKNMQVSKPVFQNVVLENKFRKGGSNIFNNMKKMSAKAE